MSLSPEDMDEVFAALATYTPAKLDEVQERRWERMLGDEDITVDEVEDAIVRLAKRQTFVAPNEVLTEVKDRRKERLALPARPGQQVLEAGAPVYPPGHPQAGERIDPDDVTAYVDALAQNRLRVARGERDRSADMAALVPGWTPRAIGGGQ